MVSKSAAIFSSNSYQTCLALCDVNLRAKHTASSCKSLFRPLGLIFASASSTSFWASIRLAINNHFIRSSSISDEGLKGLHIAADIPVSGVTSLSRSSGSSSAFFRFLGALVESSAVLRFFFTIFLAVLLLSLKYKMRDGHCRKKRTGLTLSHPHSPPF